MFVFRHIRECLPSHITAGEGVLTKLEVEENTGTAKRQAFCLEARAGTWQGDDIMIFDALKSVEELQKAGAQSTGQGPSRDY